MKVDNRFFLLHAHADIIIKRAIYNFLDGNEEMLVGIKIVDRLPKKLSNRCYLMDRGNFEKSLNENGVQKFSIVTVKSQEGFESIKFMAGEISNVFTEGEILSDLVSRVIIMKVIWNISTTANRALMYYAEIAIVYRVEWAGGAMYAK